MLFWRSSHAQSGPLAAAALSCLGTVCWCLVVLVVSAVAAACGAVNTLSYTAEGGVVGHNTDVSGLVRAVRRAFPSLEGDACCIHGAGGAARAAVLAADALGMSEIRVMNRTPAKAVALVAALDGHVRARLLDLGQRPEAFRDVTLVLQAASHGMGLHPGAMAFDEALGYARARIALTSTQACVFDLVYHPTETVWTRAAHSMDRVASSGLSMLVYQAAEAFACWTGVAPSVDAMFTAIDHEGS